MKKAGLYTWWHCFCKGEVTGQVAILITLVIAIIFLFVAVTLNISRVAQKKTITANAADGAAIKLTSQIGSYAHKLSEEYCDGGTEARDERWGGFFWLLFGTIFLAVLGQPLAAFIFFAGTAYREAIVEPRIAENIQRNLDKLPLKLRLSEQAVFYTLINTVDDPAKVIDIYDYDEDEDTTDKIGRYGFWYAERVEKLVKESSSEWEEMAGFIPQLKDFAQDADDFRKSFTEDSTRPLIDESPPPEEDGEFIILLEELKTVFEEEGKDLPVTFWVEDADNEQNFDQVDELSADLHVFYLWAMDLCEQGTEAIVQMSDAWIPQLYHPDEEDWYDTWEKQIGRIENWKPELYEVIEKLDEMIADLENQIAQETDPDRQAELQDDVDYLRELKLRVSSAIETLDEFQHRLRDFNVAILEFYYQSYNEYGTKNQAIYSWDDSLGWHHVHVKVSKFKIPWIKVKYKHGFFKNYVYYYLMDYKGDITVEVTRFDQSSAPSFFARGSTPLWKFRYVKDAQAEEGIDPSDPDQALPYGIRSKAKADYTYNRLPKLLSVK